MIVNKLFYELLFMGYLGQKFARSRLIAVGTIFWAIRVSAGGVHDVGATAAAGQGRCAAGLRRRQSLARFEVFADRAVPDRRRGVAALRRRLRQRDNDVTRDRRGDSD